MLSKIVQGGSLPSPLHISRHIRSQHLLSFMNTHRQFSSQRLLHVAVWSEQIIRVTVLQLFPKPRCSSPCPEPSFGIRAHLVCREDILLKFPLLQGYRATGVSIFHAKFYDPSSAPHRPIQAATVSLHLPSIKPRLGRPRVWFHFQHSGCHLRGKGPRTTNWWDTLTAFSKGVFHNIVQSPSSHLRQAILGTSKRLQTLPLNQ